MARITSLFASWMKDSILYRTGSQSHVVSAVEDESSGRKRFQAKIEVGFV